MAVHVQSLGSSSSGNSTLIWQAREAVLIDFGFGQRYTRRVMQENGLDIDNLRAAFVTHLHGDHVNPAMLTLLQRHQVPVFAPAPIVPPFKRRFRKQAGLIKALEPAPFQTGPFTVTAFEVPHDADGGCFGFSLVTDSKKITIATDMGFAKNGVHRHFADSDLIVLESNYDPHMLDNSGRSAELIARIKSVGHLSNRQSADFMEEVLSLSQKTPQAIVLAHISPECNLPEKALNNMRRRLAKLQVEEIEIFTALHRRPGTVITLE